ncbi:MAG: hypothetical protein WD673_14060 [Alphaproteobacteria bacterium]
MQGFVGQVKPIARSTVLGFVLFAALVDDTAAFPTLTTVDADSFAEGTILTTAFAGVTLRVVGDGSETDSSIQKVAVESGFSAFNGKNLATTGSFVFGKEPFSPGGCTGCESSVWNEDAFNLLRADFHTPTDFVQIDLIFRDDDFAFLRVFDAADNLLAELIRLGDGRADNPGEEPFFTVSATRPSRDIAYIVAGGLGGEGAFLDNLQYNRYGVAEPSTVAIMAAAMMGVAWRRSGNGRRRNLARLK